MDFARKLLDSGSYNVNEVGLKIGYSAREVISLRHSKKEIYTNPKYLMSININISQALILHIKQ
jgi:hypothetical protein